MRIQLDLLFTQPSFAPRHLALSLVALLRRKNNKYNIYKEIQRFAGTKHTLRVLQALCKVNNKKQRFAGTCAELSLLKLCHGEKECHEMKQLAGTHG